MKPLNTNQTVIMELMCEGLTAQEMADRLVISVNAINGRLVTIYNNLGARNSNHAVALYLRSK